MDVGFDGNDDFIHFIASFTLRVGFGLVAAGADNDGELFWDVINWRDKRGCRLCSAV